MGRHRVVTGNEGRGCIIWLGVSVLVFLAVCILLALTA